MRKRTVLALSLISALFLCGYESGANPAYKYELKEVHPVGGRQGICTEDGNYWVSGSGTLEKYDSDWNLITENTQPFEGYSLEVNHIGDIDVYNNELYLGVEYFMDGEGKNIQVAVYDGDTLKLKRVFPFRADTGQLECSGIAVDPDSGTVYMSSWIDDESSEYLYMYDLDSGEYKGKLQMQPGPKWIQGVAYHEGNLYVTCDDGDADDDAPDHMYRVEPAEDKETGQVILEKTFDDVIKQGEIEGLTFSEQPGRFLLLYNRGARIIAGMPSGFYEGYTEEIHEVFVYDMASVQEAGYQQISQEEAAVMMEKDDGHIILDVRRQDEFESGHIPGAICIPNETITTEILPQLPDLEQVILVYCRSGNRSKQASEKLAEAGYKNIYEFGGIITWTGETETG